MTLTILGAQIMTLPSHKIARWKALWIKHMQFFFFNSSLMQMSQTVYETTRARRHRGFQHTGSTI